MRVILCSSIGVETQWEQTFPHLKVAIISCTAWHPMPSCSAISQPPFGPLWKARQFSTRFFQLWHFLVDTDRQCPCLSSMCFALLRTLLTPKQARRSCPQRTAPVLFSFARNSTTTR
jgi:hypothetical protein